MPGIRRVYALFSPVLPNGLWQSILPVALSHLRYSYILCFCCRINRLQNGHIYLATAEFFFTKTWSIALPGVFLSI